MKEQILVEKIRGLETASDKNDERDYLQPLKQCLQEGIQVARKSDSRKKKHGKLFFSRYINHLEVLNQMTQVCREKNQFH